MLPVVLSRVRLPFCISKLPPPSIRIGNLPEAAEAVRAGPFIRQSPHDERPLPLLSKSSLPVPVKLSSFVAARISFPSRRLFPLISRLIATFSSALAPLNNTTSPSYPRQENTWAPELVIVTLSKITFPAGGVLTVRALFVPVKVIPPDFKVSTLQGVSMVPLYSHLLPLIGVLSNCEISISLSSPLYPNADVSSYTAVAVTAAAGIVNLATVSVASVFSTNVTAGVISHSLKYFPAGAASAVIVIVVPGIADTGLTVPLFTVIKLVIAGAPFIDTVPPVIMGVPAIVPVIVTVPSVTVRSPLLPRILWLPRLPLSVTVEPAPLTVRLAFTWPFTGEASVSPVVSEPPVMLRFSAETAPLELLLLAVTVPPEIVIFLL